MNDYSKAQSSSVLDKPLNSAIATKSPLEAIEQEQPKTFARSSDANSVSLSALAANNTGNGLDAEYYDNQNFTNLKLTRVDPTVNFNWGKGSPAASIGADTFSVRWTGQVEAKYSETYNFFTTTDDGVRLWVDGKQIINSFVNQTAAEVSGAIALVAGQKYDIKMEYFEHYVDAVAKLSWSSPSQTKQIIPQSQLYSNTDITPPTATANAANLTTGGGDSYTFTVNYSDNTAVNVASLDNNDVIVTGPNGFTQSAALVSVDNNSNGSQRIATYKINPLEGTTWNISNNGTYTIALQTNQVSDTKGNFASAGSIGSFQVNIAGTGTGLNAEYYDNQNFTNLKLTRVDPTVNFNWGKGSPAASIGADTFSVRWTGQVEAKYSETYNFFTTTDDGVRLWVDGKQIINSFVNQTAAEVSGAIALVAGQKYDIKMEYFEHYVDAVAKLSWSSPSQTKQIIPKSQLYLPTEPTISLGSSVTTVSESAGNAVINVVRTGDLSGTASIRYATTAVTAEQGKDYGTANSGSEVIGRLNFAAGEASKQILIPIINDSLKEQNETFSVAIDEPDGATLGVQRTLTITIQDDDNTNLSFTEPEVNENVGTAKVTVSRNNSSAVASVDYTTVDGTAKAGSDYTAVSGTLNFAVGETSKTISILIKDDTIAEPNEKFSLKFKNAVGVGLEQDTAVISIIDNDPGSFTKQTVVDGLNEPTAFDWTPDNSRMFVAQKDGVVRLIENGTLLSKPFIDISAQVNDIRDRGLLGIAVHPDFGKATNPKNYVYLLFTYDPAETDPSNSKNNPNATLDNRDQSGNRAARLIRVEADPSTNYTTAKAGSEVVLLGKNDLWQYISHPDKDSTDVTQNYAPSGILNKTTGKLFTSMQDYLNNLNNATNVEDFIATDSQSHSIGTIRFGTDGSLFVGVGDGTSYNQVDPRAIRVQDVNNLSGKILRIDPITGEGLSNNPFYNSSNPNSNASKVWNYGLRNPFRFTIDKDTNTPYIGDVGWQTWEEVNIGVKGANFGWPGYEGGLDANGNTVSLKQGSYASYTAIASKLQALYDSGTAIAPTYTYKHYRDSTGNSSDAIVVGDFYTGNTFPSIYQGTLFIADASKGTIDNLTLDSEGKVVSVRRFATNAGAPVQLTTGEDGNLYYADLYGGKIMRFTPA
ncbi:PQQ-dependent sugar dehydrogenase [Nostocaceae cyanobacterium CENA369]|uniref:PQQ-dependent sugar dehydrogenase n=1 Tax=Dendronalium phyllosphericum CENA369 TaxID=1725256 RepID=A0A8J7I9D7_9NOST|nr:PA14 domain-containing protein [Dendronalium phyllosphericum]MBH8576603.1 PQQ-dependent sugar dehydrogenase [Dendronalium phyllosphericum CENA369]